MTQPPHARRHRSAIVKGPLQRELLEALGFTSKATDTHETTWTGHGLTFNTLTHLHDAAVLMDHILCAQRNLIIETNRRHAQAILGRLPSF